MQLRPSRVPSLVMTEHTPQALGSTTLEQGISSFSPGAMGQAHLEEAAAHVAGSQLPGDRSAATTAISPRPMMSERPEDILITSMPDLGNRVKRRGGVIPPATA